MLKRYNHIGKKAAKFKFITSFQELSLNTNEKWKPRMLCLEWSRKNRSNKSKDHKYEENHSNRLSGGVVWVVPENIEFNVTLFRNKKDTVYEKKEWVLKVFDHDAKGRTKPIAFANFDLSNYSEELKPYNVTLVFKLNNKNLTSASVHFTLNASILRTGNATFWSNNLLPRIRDDDMQSQASILYDQEHGVSDDIVPDIANIADFNEDISFLSNEIASFTQDAFETIPKKDIEKTEVKIPDKEKTIEQQLIDWSNEMLHDYKNIRVTNMTTSWRNGLAFCAIIHRHRPDLIDFRSLSAHEIVENNELAFSISESEFSITRKLDANKMLSSIVPDKLFIMMYVDQLKKYFTPKEFEPPSDSSSDPITDDSKESLVELREHPSEHLPTKVQNLPESPIIKSNEKKITSSKNACISNPFENMDDGINKKDELINSNKGVLKNSNREKSHESVNSKSQISELKNRARNLINKKEKSPTKEIKRDIKENKNINKRDTQDKSQSDNIKTSSENSENNKFKISIKKNCSTVHIPSTLTTSTETHSTTKDTKSPTIECKSEVSKPESVVLLKSTETTPVHSKNVPVNSASTTPIAVDYKSESENNTSTSNSLSAMSSAASASKSMTPEQRKQDLRQRARLLIAAAKNGRSSASSSTRNTSSTASSLSQTNSSKNGSHSGVEVGVDCDAKAALSAPSSMSNRSSKLSMIGDGLRLKTKFYQFRDNKSLSRPISKISLKKPSSVKSLKENISPERKSSDGYIESEYVKAALSALELEMIDLNEKSNEIENQLRIIMSTNEDKKQEEELMKELFENVNKKNTIVKRLEQVNILAKTEDLEKRQELLTIEIGELIVRDDNHMREELLLQELVTIVDKRNALLQASHMYEQSLDEEMNCSLNDNNEQKEQCCLQ